MTRLPRRRRMGPAGPRRERLRRRMHLLPHLFTMGNLFAGFFAISALLDGAYDRAAIAIGIGMVLDGLDGAVARLVHTDSAIGVQLDSLADVVTFGIAPGLLAFSWGVAEIDLAASPWALHVRRLGWIAAFAFVAACALRLARFNVMTHDDADEPPPAPRHAFIGMPTPTAAGYVAVVVHLFKQPLTAWPWGAAWVAALFLVAGLMISRTPFPSLKRWIANPRAPHLKLLFLALLLAAIYYYSEIVLYGLLVVYLSLTVVLGRRASRVAAPGGELNLPPG
ncbi:MAG: phosphatidylcholine/phosphatidylserine synthase [Gemmatimonadota bacterium]